MTVMISEAVHDEQGKYSGGLAGDQTGDEVRVRAWYSRPWNYVIRFREAVMRNRFAYAMEAAALNKCIGYDQWQRNTCLTAARSVGYDPAKIKTICETDCSGLVVLACIYAGIPEASLFIGGNSSTTANLRSRLAATGKVDVFASKDYILSSGKLIRGDILLYEGHHVAGVTKGNLMALDEVAREVAAGKWGSGLERKGLLEADGYDYASVQKKVTELMNAEPQEEQDNPARIWKYFLDKIGNPYGVAGLMGNLQAESALEPWNLQNSFNKSLGMSDAEYTALVDNHVYNNFVNDHAGYGIAQWTSSGRKQGLLNQAKASGKSIGDLQLQMEFLWKELGTSYIPVLNVLKNALSVQEASDAVLTKFEQPRDQGDAVKKLRASYGQAFYDRFVKAGRQAAK